MGSMGRLACAALLGIGCTSNNLAYDAGDGDGDGDASRGDDDPASTGRADTGEAGEGSATGDEDPTATADTSASSSDGGVPGCEPECGPDATCIDEGDGPECACDPGFEGDGSVCTPVPTLDALAWQVDCLGTTPSCGGEDLCFVEEPPEPHVVERTDGAMLMGDPLVIYDVTLRVRAVVEPKAYVGGRTNEHWNEGGVPVADDWNAAYIEIEDPYRLIYVNAGPAAARYCLAFDHELVVRMRGGSWVEIGMSDPNNCAVINIDAPGGEPHALPDLDEPPQPHDGQLMRVEALAIVATPR